MLIGVDAYPINHSPNNYPRPEMFDPDRFLNKRSKPGTEHLHQFVSTGPNDLNWGDGIQACPGRFFANSSLKVSLAHLLTHYRIMPVAGSEGKGKQTGDFLRPNGLFSPNVGSQVMFQSRN